MARLFFLLALLSLLSGFFGLAYGGFNASSSQEYKVYIVYMGSTGGVEPEKLTASHHQLLHETLGSPNAAGGYLIYSYKYGFNGFSALLTDDHAKTLAAKAGVVSVFPSQTLLPQTINSYDFLGLTQEKAVQIGGNGSSVIIGVLDTGVWPKLTSFDDSGMGPIPTQWKGACDGGVDFESSYCNRKLIGVRYFGLGATASIKKSSNATSELLNLSALDRTGHGTHVAATAGGSVAEDAHFLDLMKGAARGGNPMARIAVYKVCWEQTGRCTDADILAAYDLAIEDGVDIITVSLASVPRAVETDSIFIGSFHATLKGILSVCAAGNTGPMPSTVANVAPWVITVGASTINRDIATWIHLGNNETFMGSSFFLRVPVPRPPIPPSPFQEQLVYGGDIPSASSSPVQSRLCVVNSLDRTKALGKIVFCEQAEPRSPHVARSYLQQIGAAGMIIIDDAYSTPPIYDLFPFSVVISSVGQSIVKYIRSNSHPTAAISDPEIVRNALPAPAVAGFSSRGPNSIAASILKPDIIAPGVTILAGTTPLAFPSLQYTIMSGTSMAAPHVSGIAALMKSQFYSWSPDVIKSALMTSAFDGNTQGGWITTNTGAPANPYDFGNGCLYPLSALNPGLVYELNPLVDYATYLCHTGLNQAQISAIIAPYTLDCSSVVVNPWMISQINLPSIAISHLYGQAFIERTVTNVGPPDSTYTSLLHFSREVAVSVSPEVLQFSASVQRLTYRISFQVVSSLAGDSAFGTIYWLSGQYHVRTSIAINSVFGSLREEPSLLEA